MKLTFLGAAGEVTGSSSLLETGEARVLVDFGLHQGSETAEVRNRRFPKAIDASRLDSIVLTHAHLDHSGRLPLLLRNGFQGPIWATPATIDLVEILLKDSANIQMMDAERISRSRARRGRAPVTPLYTTAEAMAVLTRMRKLPYDQPTEVAPGVSCKFVDAGHILGSASALLTITSGARRHTIGFSGDVGVKGSPLLRDPVPFDHADTLILESTYGDRNHRPLAETLQELTDLLADCRSCHGKVLIPAFAVGRTQNLLYFFAGLKREGRLDSARVILDSPMAIETTELYRRHRELFDEQAWAIINSGNSLLHFEGLQYSRSADESRALNEYKDHVIIIAGAGMMNGGRIQHHLRHNLWKPETTLLIVGYQAHGTLGRRIVDGAKRVRIMGEDIAVKAKIFTLGGLSAHAGQSGLVEWSSTLKKARPRVFLNHGEDGPRGALRDKLKSALDLNCELPAFGQSLELSGQ